MSYQSKVYMKQGGDEKVIAPGGKITAQSGSLVDFQSGSIPVGVALNVRAHVAIADVNAGLTILPAIAGYKYRMVTCSAIAIGGAAGAGTTVDILGTLSSSRKLVAFAQGSLTQSTVLNAGDTGAAVLADGASFTANDANTAITIGKTGSSFTTSTFIDVNLTYVIEAA